MVSNAMRPENSSCGTEPELYNLQVSYLGYETQVIFEIQVFVAAVVFVSDACNRSLSVLPLSLLLL